MGILFIDLDDFKTVNDTFGHSFGDQVLLTVAERLIALVRPGDTTARFGGDEFVVVAPRMNQTGLASLAARAVHSLSRPHILNGRSTLITGTVGSHLSGSAETAEVAIARADQAMYAEKRRRELYVWAERA